MFCVTMWQMNIYYVHNISKWGVFVETYKVMYLQLFNAVTDSIEALAAQNFGQAKEILIKAQQDAEEYDLKYGA